MAHIPLRLSASASELKDDFARVRADLHVPVDFPPEVLVEATAAARQSDPTVVGPGRVDLRDIDLVTIDPPGSRDLDQAFFAERTSDGCRVRYAIADVAAFVAAGGPMDAEAFARGVTLYLPDGRATLYPPAIGEGAASLLPGQNTPALLWTFDLDPKANVTKAHLERAVVRSREALSYAQVQDSIDAGTGAESFVLLREIGMARMELEAERGGTSVDLPSQEVVKVPSGSFELRLEQPLPVERWNAQISLMTGIEAARIMVGAGTGLLRTLPPPEPFVLDRLRRIAASLDVQWPKGSTYANVVRSVDPKSLVHVAFLTQSLRGVRGAGYGLIEPGVKPPIHAAVATHYAHVTAPLRRLADRYVNEIVLAEYSSVPPPMWATARLDEVATAMNEARRRAHAVERAVLDAVESALLAARVGDIFEAVVVDRHRDSVVVQLVDAPVMGTVKMSAGIGQRVDLRLEAVDPQTRSVLWRAEDS
jgi:exoribonuclease R